MRGLYFAPLPQIQGLYQSHKVRLPQTPFKQLLLTNHSPSLFQFQLFNKKKKTLWGSSFMNEQLYQLKTVFLHLLKRSTTAQI